LSKPTPQNFLFVFGTRPEAIKLAPVIKVLKLHDQYKVRVCVTAQHREMLDQVLVLFDIQPDVDLNLMRPGQDLTEITSNVIFGLRDVLRNDPTDWVLVHGDTSTTFAASLASFYERVKIAHIEAGLRTGNIYSPWPEEMNRRLTSVLTTNHFAPTEQAKCNLLKEGVNEDSIIVTGNTVIDALLEIVEKIRKDSVLEQKLSSQFDFLNQQKRLILVTGHRRENFGDGFKQICQALRKIAQRNDVEIVYPVHLNPNVRKPVSQILANCTNVKLIEPLDYLSFVYLMTRSYFIITDSGGIQEEAPSLGKPVLVTRNTTERPEAVVAGTVRLVGTNQDKIVEESIQLLDDSTVYEQMAHAHNPYGDGHAADIIKDYLCQ
jgi:UDP-N-acetylglucosamine 2-epimerase (non-hydrolysing)